MEWKPGERRPALLQMTSTIFCSRLAWYKDLKHDHQTRPPSGY